jgi:hypothetical protein
LFAGDRVRFVRPYLANDDLLTYVPNGTAGQVQAVHPDSGQVVVEVDDGRTVTVQPGVHEDVQPLRLGYASHALKLQGGQAAVCWCCRLAGGRPRGSRPIRWPPTACRSCTCSATQQAGPYRDPVQALGERWTRDAGKHAAASHLDRTGDFDGLDDCFRTWAKGVEG